MQEELNILRDVEDEHSKYQSLLKMENDASQIYSIKLMEREAETEFLSNKTPKLEDELNDEI